MNMRSFQFGILSLVLFVFSRVAKATFTIPNNVLIIAPDPTTALTASQMLISYGIDYTILDVPIGGATLPALNNSDGSGNFALIVVQAQVSYYYGDATGWQSALTAAQWQTIYDYQTMYSVRMIQQNVYPGPLFGATALGGCCNTGEDQTVTLDPAVAAAQFPTAGLK